MDGFGKRIKISVDSAIAAGMKDRLSILPEYHVAKIFTANCLRFYNERQNKFFRETGDYLGSVLFSIYCASDVRDYMALPDNVFSDLPDYSDQILSQF